MLNNFFRLLIILFCACGTAHAQLTKETVQQHIRELPQTVTDNYVYPAIAKKAKQYVLTLQEKGAYDTIQKGERLAAALTRDLQAITHDLHLRVFYSPTVLPKQENSNGPSPEEIEGFKQMLKGANYGIKEKSVLEGNIGYLNITMFAPLDFCADSLTAAVQAVINTDALIIDLRECGGSMDPDAIPFFSGYFFDRPTHLNDLYFRNTGDTTQYWSYGWVPGKKYGNKPIYILTSGRTFSGAEEIAYDYKNLKRAILVGEQTKGGANPGGDMRVNDHFGVFVPNGCAINPITKTNWEGVGVTPDTVISAMKALHKAQLMAVQHLWQQANTPEKKKSLQEALTAIQKAAPVYKQVQFTLKGFEKAKEVFVAGSFNGWTPEQTPMLRKGKEWVAVAEAPVGKLAYKFFVDGEWILDPAHTQTESDGRYTNSVKQVQ